MCCFDLASKCSTPSKNDNRVCNFFYIFYSCCLFKNLFPTLTLHAFLLHLSPPPPSPVLFPCLCPTTQILLPRYRNKSWCKSTHVGQLFVGLKSTSTTPRIHAIPVPRPRFGWVPQLSKPHKRRETRGQILRC